jgi:uncharacterized protein YidB (DUF937 family)
MGLLDSIAGQVIGALADGVNPQQRGLLEAVAGLITNPQTGGIQGLVNAFQQNGLGSIINSWISTGQNLPISPEQLQSALGNEQIQALAQQLGFSTQDVSGQLANVLPQLIDRLTPNGTVPENDVLGRAAASLIGSLFK